MVYPVRKDLPFYTSLKILQIYRYFPLNNQSKFQFFTVLCVWSLLWNITIIVASTLLLISSVNKQDYYLATTAFSIAMTACVISAINILFAVKYEMWSELFKRTTNCTKFGKSLKFDEIIRQGEMMGKIYFLILCFNINIIAVYEILTEEACLLSNHGRNEICGLLIPFWLPSKFATSIVFKRAVLLYQLLTLSVVGVFTAIISLQNQVCQFIGDKVKHLSMLFNKINTAGTSTLQYRQFSYCMEYYQHILKLCEQLDSISRGTMGHITLSTSLVVSLFLYLGMRGNYKLLCFAILFLPNLGILCHTGQKLEDAISQVGDIVYLTRWYDCCIEIQKVVPLVIMRSQRFVGLRAIPVGRLNYLLFAAVMKTTYTYLNLLRNTGTH